MMIVAINIYKKKFLSIICKYLSIIVIHDKRMNNKNNKELKLENKRLNILSKNKNINVSSQNKFNLSNEFLNCIS